MAKNLIKNMWCYSIFTMDIKVICIGIQTFLIMLTYLKQFYKMLFYYVIFIY